MKPQVVAHELGKRLRDDAIVCCDSGAVATWFARHIPARRGQMFSLSGTLASMANGLPYAIAAQPFNAFKVKLARRVVARALAAAAGTG